jgi:copper(I)-binding protein
MKIVTAALLLILSASTVLGADSIVINDPWVREVPPVSSVSAVYMVIDNTGDEDDKLTGVRSKASRHAELHTTKIDDNNIATMIKVDYLTLPSGEQTELKPGGSHIMLRELKSPLKAGDKVLVELIFEKSGTKIIEAEVR